MLRALRSQDQNQSGGSENAAQVSVARCHYSRATDATPTELTLSITTSPRSHALVAPSNSLRLEVEGVTSCAVRSTFCGVEGRTRGAQGARLADASPVLELAAGAEEGGVGADPAVLVRGWAAVRVEGVRGWTAREAKPGSSTEGAVSCPPAISSPQL